MHRSVTLLLVLLMIAMRALAQGERCDPQALLPSTDPAYADAATLSDTLHGHGIQVRCVLLSKEAHMFGGQLGAAFFRTDVGDFEALFLPRGQTWDHLNIIEKQEADGYTRYQFRGSPTYSGTWEGKSVSFVKHRNQFLHSLDKQTVLKLREALQEN